MPRTRSLTPVHDRPCVACPPDRVEQEPPVGGDRPDGVIRVVEHPPAPVRRLHDAAVAGTEPAAVRVEDRVALPALPGPVEPVRARHAHGVLAGGAAAVVARVEEVEPVLALDDLGAFDDGALP